MRRRTARKDNPLCIYSDNGTNFFSAERILKRALDVWNQNQTRDHILQRGIGWHFNPSSASHMGGSRKILLDQSVESYRQYFKRNSPPTTRSYHCDGGSREHSKLQNIDSNHSRTKGWPAPSPNHLLLLCESITFPPGYIYIYIYIYIL